MTINAFYLIDKPEWITSFDVLRDLRKKLNIKKMWHTGTLDPLATGALLVAVWNYTKLIPHFEKDTKEYEFTVALNWVTESFDKETEIQYISEELQEKFKKELTQEKIQSIIETNFTGNIEQVPPKYSALKIWGKKAVDLVREGKDVEMKLRKATVSKIEILSYEYPSVTLRATVSAGTYIRSIANDLWEIIGSGGYITMLRRTKIGHLSVEQWQKLDDFSQEKEFCTRELFHDKNFVTLGEDILEKINNWLPVPYRNDQLIDGEYFVVKGNTITNIIGLEKATLKAKRKIV